MIASLIAVDQEGRTFLLDEVVYRLTYCCLFCRRPRRSFDLAKRCAASCFSRRRLAGAT